MPRRRTARAVVGTLLAGSALAGLTGVGASPAAAVTPVANPPIADQCGVDVTLVLDASGSIQTSNAVNNVRDAAEAFLDSLSNTGSSARVTQFATLSEQLAPSTVVDDNSLGTGGALRNAVTKYYNPRPPRPSNVNFINTSGQIQNSENNNQYTNWDGSLHQAAETKPGLVVYVTDGDPTAYDLDQDAGFDPGPPPDVRFGTNSTDAKTNDRAIEEANKIKGTNKSRMLVVGVGNALGSQASVNRLIAISGPQVARDADLNNITSLNQVDVALVTKFTDLAKFLRKVVLQLCSPSLTIQKLAQTPGSAAYTPAQGWDMTVAPRALPPDGRGFNWILPNTTPAVSKTVATNANGFAQFQWEPIPPEANSAATVSEALKATYTPGRPGNAGGVGNDFSCDLKDEDGNVRTVTGELDLSDPQNPTFQLNPIGQEIVTCKVYNSFNYDPAIHLEKVNTPTEVRGDLADNPSPGDPPASVTSHFTVTNPGNTPLSSVHVTDSECGPATPVPATGPNAGDTNGDGRLDVGEAWEFTCVRDISTGASRNAAGQTITNTATATGTPPAGDPVSDDATDDVQVFNPAISIVKQVNGVDLATITPPAAANYTYDVSNTGNTPLANVTLDDATTVPSVAACSPRVRGPDNPGNDDDVLDVGETWHFTCTDNPDEDVVDTATVSADPVNPVTGDPFAGRNPRVTASDGAAVAIVNPDIRLEKVAEPTQVVVDANGGSQPVTYTFTATNPGDTPLNRPDAPPAGTGPSATDPGWVVDPRCDQATTFTGGDTDGDQLLDPGETWTFTCTNQVSDTPSHEVLNVAVINGQPSDADGSPLGVDPVHDFAAAVVHVLTPGIDVVKTALRPRVLDPGAPATAGPDVPTPRPAQYTYDVSNTGTVPLDLSPDPPTDTKCTPLVPDTPLGDDNGNGLLDPDEVWSYTCETTLSQADANGAGNVVNTVTATGIPDVDGTQFPDLAVSAQDTATVHVIKPGISITKKATPTAVLAGRDVTYTFAVANTGDGALSNVVPVDDKCAPLVPDTPFGDTNGDGLLDPNEVWHYTCTRQVDMPLPPATVDTNRVTVTGVDELNNTYAAADTARVTVLQPAINLEKSVSKSLVPAGSKVTYTFLATNVGTSPVAEDDVLNSTTLRDISKPANPVCRKPVLVAKEGGNQDNFLDRVPAETWRYTCQATITKPTVDLAAVGALGGQTINAKIPVADFATAQVTPFHPGIDVDKSASPTHLNGPGKVTYTYKVRNTGDVPLANVEDRITDDTCSPVRFVSGDKDHDGLLDSPHSLLEDSLDETWIFTCTTVVDKDTTNTVVVDGTPVGPDGEPLCDASQAGGRAAGATTCDTRDRSRAHVTVGPGIAPAQTDTLPNTGGPPWIRALFGLALVMLLGGSEMVAWSLRRRGVTEGALIPDTRGRHRTVRP